MRFLLITVLLGWVAFSDLTTRRIPNRLTLALAVAGLAFWIIRDGMTGLGMGLIGFAVGLGVFLVPFLFGGIGGGDVKLMAGVGAFVGWPLIVWAILLSCIVALFGTVANAIWKGTFVRLLANTWLVTKHTLVGVILRRPVDEIRAVTVIQAAAHVPFGVAIAVGAIWTVILQHFVVSGLVSHLPYFE